MRYDTAKVDTREVIEVLETVETLTGFVTDIVLLDDGTVQSRSRQDAFERAYTADPEIGL